MQELTSAGQLGDFLARLARAPERLLVLDYDGTLAPFTPERDQAAFYPGVAPLLQAIIASGTIVAFITGRSVAEISPRLPWTGIDIFGAHGHEHRDREGRDHQVPLPADALLALRRVEQELLDRGFGATLERKHGALAVHWRNAPDTLRARIEHALPAIMSCLPASVSGTPFDGGFEFRTRGISKGTALTALLDRHPQAAVAYLGDDLTDEDAFAALPSGGLGILVRPVLRPTRASVWLRPPGELLEFLGCWAGPDLPSAS
ncbi:MAG: trehalose-phosphatase [Gammaproteobacteria bacterium]|nr:trehalose-phosphatase [Gammaproteobacteria bacterium]